MADDDPFDVAISFCAKDEPTAKQLHDVLLGRLKVFLYSEEQRRLAGTDGEVTFNAVYGKQARLVVVLYRQEWGETPFTRYEATAIRNRAFTAGYDFTVFIPMASEEAVKVPPWVPKPRLWLDLPRWGIDGAAAVIEERFREQGGVVREETLEDIAARAAAAIELSDRRKRHLDSDAGVVAQRAAYLTVREEVLAGIDRLKQALPAIGNLIRKEGLTGTAPPLLYYTDHIGFQISWRSQYSNTMRDGADLEVTLWDGHPPWPGVYQLVHVNKTRSLIYHPDLRSDGTPGWRRGSPKEDPLTSKAVVDEILKFIIAGVQSPPKRRSLF